MKKNTYSIRTVRFNNATSKKYEEEVGKLVEDIELGRLWLNLYMFPDTKFLVKKDAKHDEFNNLIEE